MTRTYYDFMDEITSDELYDRLIEYGLFSEKLPPIFDMSDFLNYCKKPNRQFFSRQWYPYATYDSMRSINVPRTMGIPTPMAHERLCACLRDNWIYLQRYFKQTTYSQKHIVSRCHIRKMKGTKALFKMNYNNWKTDGTPEPDISFGKKYLVKADISQCFPSIYTHSIAWALATKKVAKQNLNNNSLFYNKIDLETRNTTNGETHGILIGPHTSNLLSEIILCRIDEELSREWDYVRTIDDYSCYVNSKEEADYFLIKLGSKLRDYNLSINNKKTEIIELPTGVFEQWSHQIQSRKVCFEKEHPYVDYNEVRSFMDFCMSLMSKNKNDASILFYAVKVLHSFNLTNNAKEYVLKTMTSLALIFPYIVPLLDKYVYTHFSVNKSILEEYINLIYKKYIEKNHFEAVSYSFYIAAKNNVKINTFDVDKIIEKHDCILSLCCLIYCRHHNLKQPLKKLKVYARDLKNNNEFEEQWPFAYECLTVGLLSGDWKILKKDNISFLK